MTLRLPVGIDIGGTKLLIVAGDRTRRIATSPQSDGAFVEEQLRRFVDEENIEPEAIGIGVPGLLDADERVHACDGLPSLVGWRAADAFRDYGCRIRALNDAEAALIEEARDFPPDITAGIVMAGSSVGAAFRVAGQPLRGASGWAGELGYFPIVSNGCVQRLDELAGGAFIASRLGVDGSELRRLADENDDRALDAIRDAGSALGLGLAGVINLFNPHLLVLGGGTLALRGYETAALEAARRYSLPGPREACTIRRVRAETVVAAGAARAATES